MVGSIELELPEATLTRKSGCNVVKGVSSLLCDVLCFLMGSEGEDFKSLELSLPRSAFLLFPRSDRFPFHLQRRKGRREKREVGRERRGERSRGEKGGEREEKEDLKYI